MESNLGRIEDYSKTLPILELTAKDTQDDDLPF